MRVGITLEDERGLESKVSEHFGQCRYFLIVDIKDNQMATTKVVPNNAQHGGGGCLAVDDMLAHKVDYVIAGGMGGGAQQKFMRANVKICGYSGKAQDAIRDFLKGPLASLGTCHEHGHSGECQ